MLRVLGFISRIHVGKVLLGLLLLFVGLLGYGISNQDADTYRSFADAVRRWQRNPDFRRVASEYVQLSNAALQTRPLFVAAPDLIMVLRRLPVIPQRLRVCETSQAHYDNFTRGPLSAYLHLSAEQGLACSVDMVERLGANTALGDDDCRRFLHSFSIEPPVVTDAGAVAGVRRLLADAQAHRPFTVRSLHAPPGETRPGYTLLNPHIEAIAARLEFPPDLRQMSAAQQQVVLDLLDDHIRAFDFDVWRTKQVNDFLSGIWAQAYGQPYTSAITGLLTVRGPCRILFPLWLLWLAGTAAYRRAMAKRAAETDSRPEIAADGG